MAVINKFYSSLPNYRKWCTLPARENRRAEKDEECYVFSNFGTFTKINLYRVHRLTCEHLFGLLKITKYFIRIYLSSGVGWMAIIYARFSVICIPLFTKLRCSLLSTASSGKLELFNKYQETTYILIQNLNKACCQIISHTLISETNSNMQIHQVWL